LAMFLEAGVKSNALEVAKGLREDLVQVAVAESVKTFARPGEVPCVWEAIVSYPSSNLDSIFNI